MKMPRLLSQFHYSEPQDSYHFVSIGFKSMIVQLLFFVTTAHTWQKHFYSKMIIIHIWSKQVNSRKKIPPGWWPYSCNLLIRTDLCLLGTRSLRLDLFSRQSRVIITMANISWWSILKSLPKILVNANRWVLFSK